MIAKAFNLSHMPNSMLYVQSHDRLVGCCDTEAEGFEANDAVSCP